MIHVHVGPDHPLVRWARTRPGRAVFATTFGVALTALAAFCLPIGVAQYRLSRDPVRTQARVLDTHAFGGRGTGTEVNTAVRYAFDVDYRTSHYRGPTGGEWCDVSEAIMNAAAAVGHVDVIYHRADPWNNAPASKERWLPVWAAGLVLVPGGLAVASWAWVGRVASEEVRRWLGGTSPERSSADDRV